MFTFEKSVVIDRPVEEVFAFMTNPDNDVLWREGVVLSEFTSDGPMGVGSTMRQVSKFMGREMDTTLEVTVYDPPYQVCVESVSGSMSFEACWNYEDHDGGTFMTFSGEADVGGFFKVAEGMVARQAKKQMDTDHANLKAVLEG